VRACRGQRHTASEQNGNRRLAGSGAHAFAGAGLVVIVIIAILIGMLLPAIQKVKD
jgi:hypothetical protein